MVLAVAGELDLATSASFAQAVAALRVERGTGVVMDVTRLAFVDSSGLNAIVGASRAVRERGGSFAVGGAAEHIDRLFEMVRLGESVAVEGSVEAALSRVTSDAADRMKPETLE